MAKLYFMRKVLLRGYISKSFEVGFFSIYLKSLSLSCYHCKAQSISITIRFYFIFTRKFYHSLFLYKIFTHLHLFLTFFAILCNNFKTRFIRWFSFLAKVCDYFCQDLGRLYRISQENF